MKQDNKNPFKGRQFTAEIILWVVRRYLQFPISYRDLERMLADRGVTVDHTTLFRWIRLMPGSSAKDGSTRLFRGEKRRRSARQISQSTHLDERPVR